ncbi:MAG: cell division protein FtsA [Synergistaceae bacterium]|nr:cell division protein FtsA [Synergistaceae bacterium]
MVGLCVGTTKIAVVVAQRDLRSREAVHIIGIGSAPSEGIRKGLIVNLEQAVRSVRSAVRDAENIVGFRLTHAVVAFNAVDVVSVNSNGMVAMGRNARPQPVQVDDVERVIDAAQSSLSIPINKLALHTIPVRYSIDGNFGVDDPLSMTGMRLEMDLQTVTVPMPYVHNVVRCVKRAGVEVEGLVIKPVAAALGALTDEEMRVGVISICIGGGTTGITFYGEGRPVKVAIIPIGGDHITNDLATVLRLPLKKAEEIKKSIFTSESGDPIAVTPRGQSERVIDPNAVLEIIGCRLEELCAEHVAALISEQDAKLFPAGIVLSGGVAKTPGLEHLLSDVFKMPVRVADPQEYYQMPPGRADPGYVNAVGTIRYILSKERNPYSFIDAPKTLWDINDFAPRPQWEGESSTSTGAGMGDTVRNIMEKIKESFKDLF